MDKAKLSQLVEEAISTDGAHHKQWYLDQIYREIHGEEYDARVAEFKDGEDGPETYEWEVGSPP